jgi:hypothetical protein
LIFSTPCRSHAASNAEKRRSVTDQAWRQLLAARSVKPVAEHDGDVVVAVGDRRLAGVEPIDPLRKDVEEQDSDRCRSAARSASS